MTRTALVAGSTGLVGGHVTDALVADPRWSRVVLLSRRPGARKDAKIDEAIVEFDALDGAVMNGVDDVFACLGTTMKTAGSPERFRKVDHDYSVEVARLARSAGATRIALVSSVGASETASSFYLRVKGETERDIEALGFASVVVARPSLLLGERGERRFGERVGIALAGVVSPLMLGGLRAYRSISARSVAAAMVEAIAKGDPGRRVLSYDDFRSEA